MSADPLANPLVSSPDSAVYDVLTQAQLLSIITSFQNGLPGATAPLVIRYLTTVTGHFAFKLNFADALHKWGEPSTGRILTPLGQLLYSKQIWRERVTAEAVAKYDTEDLATLRFQLVKCASERRPDKARRRCVHNAWESAAAFGRVDMLAWLAENHGSVVASLPMLARFAAQLALRHGHVAVLVWLRDTSRLSDPGFARTAAARAVRYGHVPVLDWLEATFGTALFAGRDDLNMKPLVVNDQRDAIHWIAERRLGKVPVGALYISIARHDTAMLRDLLASGPLPSAIRKCLPLIHFARFAHQWDAIVELVGNNFEFPIHLLGKAIQRREFAAIRCLLDHLRNAAADRSGFLPMRDIVLRLVRSDNADMLELLASADSNELHRTLDASVLLWSQNPSLSDLAVQSLMRMSSMGDIAMVLTQHAVRHDADRVAKVLALSDRPLPLEVVSFAHRVVNGTLGPLASLADTYQYFSPDAHILETMLHRVSLASQDDVRDAVLRLLVTHQTPCVGRLLAADADADRVGGACCDEAFLALCLSMRFDVMRREHSQIAYYLKHC